MNHVVNYIQASFDELKKVVWPSRKQAIWLAIVVVAAAAIVGLYISGLDTIFKSILQRFLVGASV